MKAKIIIVFLLLVSTLCFSQREYKEGTISFEMGGDLAFLAKKTKMQIVVNSDSLFVNDIAPDTLVRYLNNLYGGDGWTNRWNKYREEIFPKFFADIFSKKISDIKVDAGLDIKNPDLIMYLIMKESFVKNIKPPGMSTSSHTLFKVVVVKANSPKDIVALITLGGIPGGMQAMSSDNTWSGNIKYGCKRAGEMLGDYIVQNKK
jgi:hypothetical protein